MAGETINYQMDHYVAQPGGVGFYYTILPGTELHGPFETAELAQAAVHKVIEQSVADALLSALFGEQA